MCSLLRPVYSHAKARKRTLPSQKSQKGYVLPESKENQSTVHFKNNSNRKEKAYTVLLFSEKEALMLMEYDRGGTRRRRSLATRRCRRHGTLDEGLF